MSAIHYFQRYSQSENVATNNTLLLLSRVHAEEPAIFEAVLNDLLDKKGPSIGPVFRQQVRGSGVPDGAIHQASFRVLIEVKVDAEWDSEQLQKHLQDFGDESLRILLLIGKHPVPQNIFDPICESARQSKDKAGRSIVVIQVTFEQIIGGYALHNTASGFRANSLNF